MLIRGNRSRAIILISTMFLILVLGVLVRVAAQRIPLATDSANLTEARERARRAAHSGLEFAASQLREDPDWQGDTEHRVLVEREGLKIEQNRGNILGTIRERDGSESHFRIRFNYHDGSPGADGMDDPSADFMFKTPYISLNNMRSDVEAVVPLADTSGSVVDPFSGELAAPAHSACLLVEGASGDPDDSRSTIQVVESIYSVVPDRAVEDAVVMSGGPTFVNVTNDGKVRINGSHNKSATQGRVRFRSKDQLRFRRRPAGSEAPVLFGNDKMKVEFSFDDSKGDFVGDTSSNNSWQTKFATESVGDSKDFYRLQFDEIQQASKVPDDKTVFLKGGVYTYGKESDTSDQLVLRYYDMSFSDYQNDILDGVLSQPEVVLSHDLKETRLDSIASDAISWKRQALNIYEPEADATISLDGLVLKIEGFDLRIKPSDNGVGSFNLIPTKPPRLTSGATSLAFQTPSAPEQWRLNDETTPDSMKMVMVDSIVSTDSNLLLQGSVVGRGATLTSGGEVKILSGRRMAMNSEAKSEKQQKKEFRLLSEMGRDLEVVDEGTSVTPADGKNAALQLNIYAKKDLFVSSFAENLGPSGMYRDLLFRGLLYSWEDVRLYAADATSTAEGGNVTVRGAIVAYGADPADDHPGGVGKMGVPGSTGKGTVHVIARNARFHWDPQYLPNLLAMQPEGSALFTIERTSLHYLDR